MTGFANHSARIEILAPDAASALTLERRLAHLRPTAVGGRFGWSVELEDADERLEEIEAAVRHWLRDAELRSTLIRVDGGAKTIAARPVEEAALTHEP